MWRRALPVVVAVSAVAAAAAAQVPLGSEFRVNNYTTGSQSEVAIASAPDTGQFIVAWTSMGQDGNAPGVFARRYDLGVAQGSAFQVNTYTTLSQNYPAVAADASGNFVVAWTSYQGISAHEVFAQRFNAAGVPQGGEFRLNAYTTHVQSHPAIAMDAAGNFVVAWTGRAAGDFDGGIAARRFDALGNPIGGDFLVNTYTTGGQFSPAVAIDGIGRFVVLWTSLGQDGSGSGVFGQRFAANGTKSGPEFRVSSITTGEQNYPALAAQPDGDFILAWTGADAQNKGVFARFWPASTGGTFGPEFALNSFTTQNQQKQRVAWDVGGNLVAVWESEALDGNVFGVAGRRFNPSLQPESDDFVVNTYVVGQQLSPAVALDSARHFFVTWLRSGDGDGLGVYAQRVRPDVISSDGFESGDMSAWSLSAVDGGDLSISGAAALGSSDFGLQGLIDDTAGLWVQDDLPVGEARYRARFHISTNDFDPGEALAHRRVRILIGFQSSSRRVFALVLRRVNGAYSIRGRARLDDDSQADTPFVPISGGAHVVEVDWQRSSGASANDGRFEMWIDGTPAALLTGLDNNVGMVDYVRMGAIAVKTGANGTLYWDEFESRRSSYIGP